jgi:RNA polymerase sigma-70 factor, ECF subfamily
MPAGPAAVWTEPVRQEKAPFVPREPTQPGPSDEAGATGDAGKSAGKPRLVSVSGTGGVSTGAAAPLDSMRDAELLDRVCQGDEHAFRFLVSRHLQRVVAVARHMLGDASEAEDVAQDAFLRLWRNAGSLDVPASGLGGWLYRVTANLSLDRLRARKPGNADGLELLPAPATQLKALSERQLGARVELALAGLPERQRLALVLCHYEGLDMAEAGAIIGVSVEAIESLLARGRRTLKTVLANEWRSLLPETDSV